MIQDKTSVFPKAFTELTFGLSDVLKVTSFTCYQVYEIFGVSKSKILYLNTINVKAKYMLVGSCIAN